MVLPVAELPRLLPTARAALARALIPIWESGLAVGLAGLAGAARGDFDEVASRAAGAVADFPAEAGRVLQRLEVDHGLVLLPLELLRQLLRAVDSARAEAPAVERFALVVRAAVLDALAMIYAEGVFGRPERGEG